MQDIPKREEALDFHFPHIQRKQGPLTRERPSLTRLCGFTLIELLMVVAIFGILAALISAAIPLAVSSSRGTQCASNLRQISTALFAYASEHDGHFPEVGGVIPLGTTDPETGTGSWLEQLDSYTEGNRKLFQCPANPQKSPNNYFMSAYAAYVDNANKVAPQNLRKMTHPSANILIGDSVARFTEPDADKDDAAPDANPAFGGDPIHHQRVNIIFADGHAEAVAHFDKNRMTRRYEGVGFDYSQ